MTTQIYSCNEGNYALWDAPTRAFVDECKNKPTPYVRFRTHFTEPPTCSRR